MAANLEGLRPGDILEVSSREGAPSGVSIPAWGSVLVLGGDGGDVAMVEEHERLHWELNIFTSFGYLLSELGRRVRVAEPREREMRRRRLARAVALCRTTHEVYATTAALWRTGEAADEGLRDYPSYREYLDLGRAISGDFAEPSAAGEYLVATASWAAMGVPIHGISFEIDDDSSDPAGLARELHPDRRLLAIVERRESLDFSWVGATLPDAWLTHPLVSSEVTDDPSFLETSIGLAIRLYLQFGTLLEELGMPVLEWDGHRRYNPDGDGRADGPPAILAEIDELESPGFVVRLTHETLAITDERYRIESLERQRLDRRPPSWRLSVRQVDSFPTRSPSEWDLRDFVRQRPTPHILLVVRPVEAVVEQYEPDEETVSMLRSAATDGVLTALRVTHPGAHGAGPVTTLALLTRWRQLDRLTELSVGDGFPPNIFASISFSCLGSAAWVQEWLAPLRILSFPTILFDSLPSRWLAAQERAEDHDGCAFSAVRIFPAQNSPSPKEDVAEGLVVEMLEAEGYFDQWTLFFGGPGLLATLGQALLSLNEIPARVDSDRFPPHSPPIVVMTRLAAEEPWFDWDGGSYGRGEEIVEPEADAAVLDRCMALARARRERQERWIEVQGAAADLT